MSTTKQNTKNLVIAALMMAVGLELPFLTGQIPQIGNMLCPMHLPVLLCGFLCGWQYGAVVGNPFMLIPTVLIAIILPGFSYLWFAMGWGTINCVNFDMNFAPNAVSAFFMSGGDVRNVLLVCINFVIAALIWYPFFKAADKAELKREEERAAAKAAKAAAKANA